MLGKHIWALRKKQNIEIEKVSEISGIAVDVLKEIESSNVVKIPNTDLAQISKAFSFAKIPDYLNFLNMNGKTRRFRLYATGLPKTGTVSLYGVFKNYASKHEFLQWDTNCKTIDFQQNKISTEEFSEFIDYRDSLGCMELDSAYFNSKYINTLLNLYPESKFIILFREPASWVKSHINYFMPLERSAIHAIESDNGFPFDIPPGDQQIRDELINNIEKYIEVPFKSWARAFDKILDETKSLDKDRILFVNTSNIDNNISNFSRLANVEIESLISENKHLNKANYTINVLDLVGKENIDGIVKKHCLDIYKKLEEKERWSTSR